MADASLEVRKQPFLVRTKTFFHEVVEEMRKVTWPNKPQLINSTWVILIFVLVVAAIIWLMDATVRGLVNAVINVFAG
jgi:preprotein translocase subunit SecE